MPCTTYYDAAAVRFHRDRVKDADVNELLDEIVALSGREWFVREVDGHEPRRFQWLRGPKVVPRYAVMVDVRKGVEWQIINFAPERPGGWPINHYVSRATLLAFLMGYRNGLAETRRAAE